MITAGIVYAAIVIAVMSVGMWCLYVSIAKENGRWEYAGKVLVWCGIVGAMGLVFFTFLDLITKVNS